MRNLLLKPASVNDRPVQAHLEQMPYQMRAEGPAIGPEAFAGPRSSAEEPEVRGWEVADVREDRADIAAVDSEPLRQRR